MSEQTIEKPSTAAEGASTAAANVATPPSPYADAPNGLSRKELDALAVDYWGASTFDPTPGSPPVTFAALKPGEQSSALRRYEAKHRDELPKEQANAAGLVTLGFLERFRAAPEEDMKRLRRHSMVEIQTTQYHLQKSYDDLLAALVELTTECEKKLDSFDARLKALEERK